MRMNPLISLVAFWTMTIEWFKEKAAEKRLGLRIQFLYPGLLGCEHQVLVGWNGDWKRDSGTGEVGSFCIEHSSF